MPWILGHLSIEINNIDLKVPFNSLWRIYNTAKSITQPLLMYLHGWIKIKQRRESKKSVQCQFPFVMNGTAGRYKSLLVRLWSVQKWTSSNMIHLCTNHILQIKFKIHFPQINTQQCINTLIPTMEVILISDTFTRSEIKMKIYTVL